MIRKKFTFEVLCRWNRACPLERCFPTVMRWRWEREATVVMSNIIFRKTLPMDLCHVYKLNFWHHPDFSNIRRKYFDMVQKIQSCLIWQNSANFSTDFANFVSQSILANTCVCFLLLIDNAVLLLSHTT